MRSGVAYFKFAAIVFILFGLIALVLPDEYISLFGAAASVGGRIWGRGFGAIAIGFGVMFWMMDPRSSERERRIGASGAALGFGLTVLADAMAVITTDLPAYGWAFVAFNVVMTGLALYYLFTPAPSAD